MDSSSVRAAGVARLAGPAVVVLFPLIVASITLGLWTTGLRTQDLFAVAIPLTALLVAIPLLSRTSFVRSATAIPLWIVVIPTAVLFLLPHIPAITSVLQSMQPSWLIGLQVFRLGGGVWLVALASRELARPHFSAAAGSLDILVGATAIPVGALVATGSGLGTVTGIAWNVIGLIDFILAVALARLPGGGPRTMLTNSTATFRALRPAILGIIVFGIPVAIVLHVLSLYQLTLR